MRIVNNVLVVLLGLGVSTAIACPGHGKAKSGCNKPCGAKSVTTVADKPVDDGRSETAPKISKGGCNKPCGKSAITVADKPAEDKTAKGGCNKPCGKSAITVADKPGEGKTAKGGCNKPCGHKGGKAVTTGHKGCSGGCSKDCCKKKGAALASGKSDGGKTYPCPLTGKPITEADCPIRKRIESVLTSIPAMKYRIGDEVTRCSKSAKALAEKSDKPIEYVVGENVFSSKGDAIVKLTALFENQADELQAVQYVVDGKPYHCGMSAGKVAKKAHKSMIYRVGGVDFEAQVEAEDALISIESALSNVKLNYKVGDNSYCCGSTAAAKAKETGKKLTYVVGDTETCCEKTAKMKLAEAKVRAIVEAAVRTSLSL